MSELETIILEPGTLDDIYIGQFEDGLKQQVLEHANRVDRIPAIIETVAFFQFLVHKGKVDQIVDLAERVILLLLNH